MNTQLLLMTVLLIGREVSGQRTSNSDHRQNGMSQSMLIGQTHLLNVLIQKINQQQQATSNLSHQLDDQRVYMVTNISQRLMNVDQSANVIKNISHQLTNVVENVKNLTESVNEQFAVNQQEAFIPPGWILVQQHYNGSTYFNRGWNDYKNGFGDVRGDYWIGNDWLHLLTSSSGRYKLRFDLQAKNNSQWYWAEYSTFSVGDENTNYTLTVSGYTGTAEDSFSNHNRRKFVTLDRNNDKGCATGQYGISGGFWYGSCSEATINASPLLYSSNGPWAFYWNIPVGRYATTDRQLLTSRMWLVPL